MVGLTLLLACHSLTKVSETDSLTSGGDSGTTDSTPGTTPTATPSVLILVMDGVRVEEFVSDERISDITNMSGEAFADQTWASLAPDSTVVRAAYNLGATVTSPAHEVILSGRIDPYAHLANNNSEIGVYQPIMPGLFQAAADQLGLGEEDMAFVANTELLPSLVASSAPGEDGRAQFIPVYNDDGYPSEQDAEVFETLDALIDEGAPRILIANIHQPDREGHYADNGDYAGAIENVDALIADFWTRLKADHPDYVDNLLLMLTTDHGRHRHDLEDGWYNHGDSCTGCREVPLMIAGGGSQPGVALEVATQLDLAPTLAAHLGITLPWAQGLPLSAAISTPERAVRSGDVSVAIAGETRAVQRWRDDDLSRCEIVVDDEVVSTAGAFAAMSPALATDGLGRWLWFREVDLDAEADYVTWLPKMLEDTGDGWEDIGFPVEHLGPFTQVHMFAQDGTLWAWWDQNVQGIGDNFDGIGVNIARHTDAGWGTPLFIPASFPQAPTLALQDDGALLAFATHTPGAEARNTRRIATCKLTDTETGLTTCTELTQIDPTALLGIYLQVEQPALRVDGDNAVLSMYAFDTDQWHLVVATSTDGGVSWPDLAVWATAGEPFPQIRPQWVGDQLVYAARDDDGQALICRTDGSDSGDATSCIELDTERVDSFHADAIGVVASVDRGEGAWSIETWTW